MLHQERLARTQALMRQHKIDAYLILTHDDYRYFFGEDRFQPRGILPAVGPPIIVTFRGEEAEGGRSSPSSSSACWFPEQDSNV